MARGSFVPTFIDLLMAWKYYSTNVLGTDNSAEQEREMLRYRDKENKDIRYDQIRVDIGHAIRLANLKERYSDRYNNSFVREQALGCRSVAEALRENQEALIS